MRVRIQRIESRAKADPSPPVQYAWEHVTARAANNIAASWQKCNFSAACIMFAMYPCYGTAGSCDSQLYPPSRDGYWTGRSLSWRRFQSRDECWLSQEGGDHSCFEHSQRARDDIWTQIHSEFFFVNIKVTYAVSYNCLAFPLHPHPHPYAVGRADPEG